jgi:hypothetical protein
MANKVMELKPTMTKAMALKLLLDYVKDFGYPERDVTFTFNVGDPNSIKEWTFNSLCKFLIDEPA